MESCSKKLNSILFDINVISLRATTVPVSYAALWKKVRQTRLCCASVTASSNLCKKNKGWALPCCPDADCEPNLSSRLQKSLQKARSYNYIFLQTRKQKQTYLKILWSVRSQSFTVEYFLISCLGCQALYA